MKRNLFLLFLVSLRIQAFCIDYSVDTTFVSNKRYINFPVIGTGHQSIMRLSVNGKVVNSFYINLAPEKPDYWVYYEAMELQDKTVTITYEGNDDRGIHYIFQSDNFVGEDSLYKERLRPQVHFSTKRGTTGDANGMIYIDGEYHMFFQHSPYGPGPRDMHWGHAISSDLLHWKQLHDALAPDDLGEIYSGSAVIDHNNTAGFGKNAMVAIYTNDKDKPHHVEVQSLAYSNDKGRTWTKYENNPVMDINEEAKTVHTRDPKVFWHEPTECWVMVLFVMPGFNIYTSPNLKEWTYQSRIEGFHECPELFPLAVDGDKNNIKWVMYDVRSNYMIGDFDGKVFTPQTPILKYRTGPQGACQSFNNIPISDGRRIQTGSAHTVFDRSSFNSMMALFSEVTIRTTPNGLRLFNYPIKEYEKLHMQGKRLSGTADEVNAGLKEFKSTNPVRIKAKVKFNSPLGSQLSYNGQPIVKFDFKINDLMAYDLYPQQAVKITLDIIIDRTSIETFVDQGRYSYLIVRDRNPAKKDGLIFSGENIEIESLEIYPLKSIWK